MNNENTPYAKAVSNWHAAVRNLQGSEIEHLEISENKKAMSAVLKTFPAGSMVMWLDESGYHDSAYIKTGPATWTTHPGVDPTTMTTAQLSRELVEEKICRGSVFSAQIQQA